MGNKESKKSQKSAGGVALFVRVLRWAYHSVLALCSAGLLMVYLLSAFSERLNPLTFHYIAYFGVGFHIILFVVLAWTVAMSLLQRWKHVLIFLLALVLTYSQISRAFPVHFGKREGDGRELKLLTYNTCGMGQTHLSNINEKIHVLDVIRESGADVVCLQEYAFSLSKGGYTQEKIVSSLHDIYPYYDYLPNCGRDAMGIALFSKFPIKHKERIDNRKKNYASSMFYELEIDGRPVFLVNNHLHSNKIQPHDRKLYDEMIEHFDKDSLERIHTGMIRSLGRGILWRASQSDMIRTYINNKVEGKDIPIVVCGDMNDTPVSYCYRTMRGDLLDAWQEQGLGLGTTYNRQHFWFRIDHIFHSDHFETADISVLSDYSYSDHYPVIATLRLQDDGKKD